MSEDLTAYQQCVADGSSGDALVECIANELEQSVSSVASGIDSFYLIFAG